MIKKITERNIFRKTINFLSHPAWNGVNCFITALAMLGFGGFALGFIFGLFSRIQDLALWLSEPLNISRYVIVGGSIVLMAFTVTTIQQYLTSHGKFLLPRKSNKFVENKPKFLPIPLNPGIGNSYLKDRYIAPPFGDVVLGGAQFLFKADSLIFDTKEQIRESLPLNNGGKEIDFQLPKPEYQVKSVYFLINSGNSKSIYSNECIGEIRLLFKDAPPIVIELVLGLNIREWCPGNPGEYVREVTSPTITMDAWKGLSKSGASAVMDCMQIPVYECMRNCFLEKIIFIYKPTQRPTDTMGVHFSVFAVSLEIEQRM
jgi:hypothetical protein